MRRVEGKGGAGQACLAQQDRHHQPHGATRCTMELDTRGNKLKTFTAFQSHLTEQLVGKCVDHGESMMCSVVANFSGLMLRDMVQRYKKVILPEQNQLEVTRYGTDRTLFDQIVYKLLKHQAKLPLFILQKVRR